MIYIESIVNKKAVEERKDYPHNIPSIRNLNKLTFQKEVTFITGENGSGKSTLIEALAINAGFNPEGGTRNFNFQTQDSHSGLYEDIYLIRSGYRNKDGFFLRAESFYNVATEVDRVLGRVLAAKNYGGSLHEKSHGESFLSLMHHRFSGEGLYIMDEPESALSITSQLNMLIKMRELVEKRSQFIIATHSPILLAYPDAEIYCVREEGIERIDYESSDQYQLTKYFINHYPAMLKELGLL